MLLNAWAPTKDLGELSHLFRGSRDIPLNEAHAEPCMIPSFHGETRCCAGLCSHA